MTGAAKPRQSSKERVLSCTTFRKKRPAGLKIGYLDLELKMANPIEAIKELKDFIASSATNDAELRKKLLQNPDATIQSLVPGIGDLGLSFSVVEEKDNEIVITLPPDISLDENTEEELTQDQLAGVSGGVAFGVVKAAIITACIFTAKAGAAGSAGAVAGYYTTEALKKT